MTEAETTVLLIKGAISDLPPDQAQRCLQIAGQIRALVLAEQIPGALALALVVAEQQAALDSEV